MEEMYMEPARAIPVHDSCDVLVVGGGTACVIAAIASARTGAKTILIEQNGYLGGTIHGGVCGVHSFYNNYQYYNREPVQLVRGIPQEIVSRMQERGGCFGHVKTVRGYQQFDTVTVIDREMFKEVSLEMTEEAGVKLLLYTVFCETIMENDVPVGVIIQSKNGREVIRAKRIVDTSGDADAAASCGCGIIPQDRPYNVGRVFAMANVDIPKLAAYLEELGVMENLAYVDEEQKSDRYLRIATSFMMNPQMKAWANDLNLWGIYTFSLHEGELTYFNGPKAAPLKDFSPEEYTRADIETMKIITNTVRVCKEKFPGFEKAYVSWIAPQIGVRRTRTVHCEHMLTSADVESGARFEDEIGLYGYHDMAPRRTINGGAWYGIPYRALIPVGVDNILVAGRMITAEHDAHMSTRNSASCMLQGQAAGTAAALSVLENVSPRNLDAGKLREKLRGDGVYLG